MSSHQTCGAVGGRVVVVGYDAAIVMVVVVVGLVVDVVLVLVVVCFVLASDEHTPSSTDPELS